jgi:hypothetical protein
MSILNLKIAPGAGSPGGQGRCAPGIHKLVKPYTIFIYNK